MIDPNEITDEEFEAAYDFDFPGFVCSLGYVAEWSKPELLYARSFLSSYLSRWNKKIVDNNGSTYTPKYKNSWHQQPSYPETNKEQRNMQ